MATDGNLPLLKRVRHLFYIVLVYSPFSFLVKAFPIHCEEAFRYVKDLQSNDYAVFSALGVGEY